MNKQRVSYKSFSFRLKEETKEKLREIKIKENKSFNLLFLDFIKKYEKKEPKKIIFNNLVVLKNNTPKKPTADNIE